MVAPNSIILDTRPQVLKLRRLAKNVELIEGRHFIPDILEDVMHCLRNARTAKHELEAFVSEIKSGQYEYGYTLLDGKLAEAVDELGKHIFSQLQFHSIYWIDGILPYHYYTVADPHFHDVYLRQTHELT